MTKKDGTVLTNAVTQRQERTGHTHSHTKTFHLSFAPPFVLLCSSFDRSFTFNPARRVRWEGTRVPQTPGM